MNDCSHTVDLKLLKFVSNQIVEFFIERRIRECKHYVLNKVVCYVLRTCREHEV